MKLTGGQAVVKALAAHSVEKVFCVAGESYLAALDAMVDEKATMQVVTCRHEGPAAFMAEAYGKLTGKPGICFVTRGPGACNASIGVHTAKQDSTPMLLFIGQVAREDRGREAFQEIDFSVMFAPVAKRCLRIDDPAQAADIVSEAFFTALDGRPGPVIIELPEDALRETAEIPALSRRTVTTLAPSSDNINAAMALLQTAKSPVAIVGGSGWDDASCKSFASWAEKHKMPVACSFRRHDLFPHTSDSYIGELGTGPNPKLLETIKKADVVLAIGTRLSEITTQGYTLFTAPDPIQKIIHIYPDAAELGHVYKPAIGIAAHPRAFIAALPTLNNNWADWLATARADYLAWSDITTKPDAAFTVDINGIYKQFLALLPSDAVITTDAGNFTGWAQRYIRYGRPMRLLAPTSGAMGYGVPAAIAASIVNPDRTVIGLMGDGGFMMTAQDIATAIAYGARPILIVFNNGIYGTIRMHQEIHYPARTIATDLKNPDFAAFARSFGANGITVEKTSDFEATFKTALASKLPTVIELKTDPRQITTQKTLDMLGKK